jgi:high-affinity nickel-transport protein
MQDGQKPITVGLFFSLGHSSVVVLATVVIAFAASALESHLQSAKAIGGLIGTSVSAAFLFAIAFANVLILMGVFRAFQRVKNGEPVFEEDLDIMLANFGILRRVFKPIFGVIRSSWHLFPIGFLFGLGFDTATEIGVLGISAAGAAEGLPIWSILVLPALFTAAMTLIDTINNILVMGAYDWAFAKPIRKLYYNMIITFVSVVIAFTVGGIEVLGVIGNKLGLDQGFWAIIATLNANFGALGYLIIVIFVMVWLLSVLVYIVKGYDRIEVTRA